MSSSFTDAFDAAMVMAQHELAPSAPGLRLTQIDEAALKQWTTDWQARPGSGRINFDWDDLAQENHSLGAPFNLAMYAHNVLCGMAKGYVSGESSKAAVILEAVEGAPYRHPLKGMILFCTLQTLEIFAQREGFTHIRADRPKWETCKLYEQIPGYIFYGLASECNFFEKKLDRRSKRFRLDAKLKIGRATLD